MQERISEDPVRTLAVLRTLGGSVSEAEWKRTFTEVLPKPDADWILTYLRSRFVLESLDSLLQKPFAFRTLGTASHCHQG